MHLKQYHVTINCPGFPQRVMGVRSPMEMPWSGWSDPEDKWQVVRELERDNAREGYSGMDESKLGSQETSELGEGASIQGSQELDTRKGQSGLTKRCYLLSDALCYWMLLVRHCFLPLLSIRNFLLLGNCLIVTWILSRQILHLSLQ